MTLCKVILRHDFPLWNIFGWLPSLKVEGVEIHCIMNSIIVKEYVGLILLLSSNQNYQSFAII